jgi:hypothetical protein
LLFFLAKYLPKGCTVNSTASVRCWILIRADSGRAYRVFVEELSGQQVLTHGWADLVGAEGISNGDIGYFEKTADGEFEFVVHNIHGVRKASLPIATPHGNKQGKGNAAHIHQSIH